MTIHEKQKTTTKTQKDEPKKEEDNPEDNQQNPSENVDRFATFLKKVEEIEHIH